jgi:ParB family chromosome partitioning protein
MPNDMESKDQVFSFTEPYKKYKLELRILPISKIEVVKHQRKPSEAHVKHLISSIERIGFLVPVITVKKADGSGYMIIDGQHRFLAAQKLGITEIPAIIVPSHLAEKMMNLNIEKELNIREKAQVALAIYREYLSSKPDSEEADPLIVDSIENAYYVTLGIGYERAEKLTGSAFESILKKCDGFLTLKLSEAIRERERRAEKVIEANNYVKSIAEKIKEMGRWHPFVYQQIISASNPFKRKRKIQEGFDEAINKMIERLKEIEKKPEQILREAVEF